MLVRECVDSRVHVSAHGSKICIHVHVDTVHSAALCIPVRDCILEWCAHHSPMCTRWLICYFCPASSSNAFAVICGYSPDRVILYSRRLMLITLLNDGTLISIGYDNVKPSHYPEKWNLRVGEKV